MRRHMCYIFFYLSQQRLHFLLPASSKADSQLDKPVRERQFWNMYFLARGLCLLDIDLSFVQFIPFKQKFGIAGSNPDGHLWQWLFVGAYHLQKLLVEAVNLL